MAQEKNKSKNKKKDDESVSVSESASDANATTNTNVTKNTEDASLMSSNSNANSNTKTNSNSSSSMGSTSTGTNTSMSVNVSVLEVRSGGDHDGDGEGEESRNKSEREYRFQSTGSRRSRRRGSNSSRRKKFYLVDEEPWTILIPQIIATLAFLSAIYSTSTCEFIKTNLNYSGFQPQFPPSTDPTKQQYKSQIGIGMYARQSPYTDDHQCVWYDSDDYKTLYDTPYIIGMTGNALSTILGGFNLLLSLFMWCCNTCTRRCAIGFFATMYIMSALCGGLSQAVYFTHVCGMGQCNTRPDGSMGHLCFESRCSVGRGSIVSGVSVVLWIVAAVVTFRLRSLCKPIPIDVSVSVSEHDSVKEKRRLRYDDSGSGSGSNSGSASGGSFATPLRTKNGRRKTSSKLQSGSGSRGGYATIDAVEKAITPNNTNKDDYDNEPDEENGLSTNIDININIIGDSKTSSSSASSQDSPTIAETDDGTGTDIASSSSPANIKISPLMLLREKEIFENDGNVNSNIDLDLDIEVGNASTKAVSPLSEGHVAGDNDSVSDSDPDLDPCLSVILSCSFGSEDEDEDGDSGTANPREKVEMILDTSERSIATEEALQDIEMFLKDADELSESKSLSIAMETGLEDADATFFTCHSGRSEKASGGDKSASSISTSTVQSPSLSHDAIFCKSPQDNRDNNGAAQDKKEMLRVSTPSSGVPSLNSSKGAKGPREDPLFSSFPDSVPVSSHFFDYHGTGLKKESSSPDQDSVERTSVDIIDSYHSILFSDDGNTASENVNEDEVLHDPLIDLDFSNGNNNGDEDMKMIRPSFIDDLVPFVPPSVESPEKMDASGQRNVSNKSIEPRLKGKVVVRIGDQVVYTSSPGSGAATKASAQRGSGNSSVNSGILHPDIERGSSVQSNHVENNLIKSEDENTSTVSYPDLKRSNTAPPTTTLLSEDEESVFLSLGTETRPRTAPDFDGSKRVRHFSILPSLDGLERRINDLKAKARLSSP